MNTNISVQPNVTLPMPPHIDIKEVRYFQMEYLKQFPNALPHEIREATEKEFNIQLTAKEENK